MAAQIQVLALTKYDRLGASSRYRFLNYIPLLANRNIRVTPSPLLSDDYIRKRLAGSNIDYFDVVRSYFLRLLTIAGSSRFNVLWIEGELFPRWPATIVRLLRRLGKPIVVDLDDAIFHSYDLHPNALVRTLLGRKIDVIFNRATAVVVGNDYLAERARKAGARHVIIIPTSVDHRAYAAWTPTEHDRLTFGWIGSAATERYLQTIAPELEELCHSLRARLYLIGIEQHRFNHPDVVLNDWTEASEIEHLAACDIGLAPLTDGPWERGKCGLKAIQYMATGIPVLAANAGVLPTVVRHGETGFIYRNSADFKQFARKLANDPDLRQRLGEAGRKRVAECYSIHHRADSLAVVLADAASQAGSQGRTMMASRPSP